MAREADDKHNTAYALFGQGQILSLRDDLRGARKLQEEALGIRKGIGETATAAESSLELASIALEGNRLTEAQTLAKEALSEFRAEKLRESEVRARVVLARTYLAEGKIGDARKEMELAGALAAKSAFVEIRLGYAIESARLKAAAGNVGEGLTGAGAALAEALRLGYQEYVLEAGLALGEMEIKTGQAGEGRWRLEAVVREARQAGFLGVARRAEKALSGK
jgi:tetratricopeptide (TPR) repeat protein